MSRHTSCSYFNKKKFHFAKVNFHNPTCIQWVSQIYCFWFIQPDKLKSCKIRRARSHTYLYTVWEKVVRHRRPQVHFIVKDTQYGFLVFRNRDLSCVQLKLPINTRVPLLLVHRRIRLEFVHGESGKDTSKMNFQTTEKVLGHHARCVPGLNFFKCEISEISI